MLKDVCSKFELMGFDLSLIVDMIREYTNAAAVANNLSREVKLPHEFWHGELEISRLEGFCLRVEMLIRCPDGPDSRDLILKPGELESVLKHLFELRSICSDAGFGIFLNMLTELNSNFN